MNLGSLPVASSLFGQNDLPVLKNSELVESLIPSVCIKSTASDIEGSGDFGVSSRDNVRVESHVHTVLKKGFGKKSSKCVRKLDKPLLLVVGEDVPLNEIVLTNALTLVGRFGGRKISAEGLHRWVSDSWLREVSIYLKIFILPWGWFAFKFHYPNDEEVILKGI